MIKDHSNYLLFLSGLTSVLFIWLLGKVQCCVQKLNASLTLEDHLLIVLMKLSLGLSNGYLADRFRASESTFSNFLRSWVPVMAKMLKSFIKLQVKAVILENMP